MVIEVECGLIATDFRSPGDDLNLFDGVLQSA